MSEEHRLTIVLPPQLLETIAARTAELVREQAARAPESSPWLDLEGAAKYLGFTRDRLYKLTAAGAIPCRRKRGGQRLLFHRDELDQWLEATYPREGRPG
jgi:excisionase family DNA binding protein